MRYRNKSFTCKIMSTKVTTRHVIHRKNRKALNFNKRKTLDNQEETYNVSRKKYNNKYIKADPDGFVQQKKSAASNKEQSTEFSRTNIQESIVYYEKILHSLKQGFDEEYRDSFVSNVLQESEGKEVELCCHNISSHCIELLLNNCKNNVIMKRFMVAFAEQKIQVCTNGSASHITELLIFHAVCSIKNWAIIANNEENEESKFITYCIIWLTEFGNFVLENLNDCLFNSYTCHVLTTLIQALSGDINKENKFMSKKSRNHKQEFNSKYNDLNVKFEAPNSITLEEIPKYFATILKKLYKSLVTLENLYVYCIESSSATAIEALLSALTKRLPKSCRKMIVKMAKNLFARKNGDGVPVCLLHQNCSFVVDKMFKAADEDLQLHLWNEYIVNSLQKIVAHSVGNFVVQRIFDTFKSRIHFETICESIWPLFDDVLKSKNFGIFVSIANACVRLKTQQPSFMKHIMESLKCSDTDNKQTLLVPLLLGFQTYDKYMSSKESCKPIFISLQGSLIVQAVLKFLKPLKVVKSIFSMPPEDLEFLAGHMQGCHILHAFFSSVSVGEKNKEKLLHHMKPVITSIACDRNKSLTLSRIWVLLSLKLKETLVKDIIEYEDVLRDNPNGNVILKKFGIFHFRKDYKKWKEIQSCITYPAKS